jgi:glycosyltransferase involved in cell wall biosynthesis
MVAPLRIARGVQNKVLEAMAMGLPVVGTRAAFEGIAVSPSPALRIADDAAQFAVAARALIACDRAGADALRAQVAREHDWGTHLARLQALVEKSP